MALLDTCTFIWLTGQTESISPKAMKVLESTSDLWISAMTVIEIHRLLRAGRLEFQMKERDLEPWLEAVLEDFSIHCQSITREIAHRSETLPWHHKDPADRMIVATAQLLDQPLITPDHSIARYAVKTIW